MPKSKESNILPCKNEEQDRRNDDHEIESQLVRFSARQHRDALEEVSEEAKRLGRSDKANNSDLRRFQGALNAILKRLDVSKGDE